MLVALLSACFAPAPVVGETLTDDGTWRLTLSETYYDQGAAEIEVLAEEAETGARAIALSLIARPDMPDMAHSLALTTFEPGGQGDYHAEILFDMPGLWTLTGYAGPADSDDERAQEGFSLKLMVDP